MTEGISILYLMIANPVIPAGGLIAFQNLP